MTASIFTGPATSPLAAHAAAAAPGPAGTQDATPAVGATGATRSPAAAAPVAACPRPITGHLHAAPGLTTTGDVATLECRDVHYADVNDAVRAAIGAGATTVRLRGINGQRHIATGLRGEARIEVDGVPGQGLAMFMDGPTVDVSGNAQDGVGNTMNSGLVVVRGDAGDVAGYGMRGGRLFIAGDVGYRVGIHMKAYESQRPVVVCGGTARDFFGEYMAGGLLVLLGLGPRRHDAILGTHVGAGMHGGEIYVRGEVAPHQCAADVRARPATDTEMGALRPTLDEYCAALGIDPYAVASGGFTRIAPVSSRPYGSRYASL